MATVRERNTGAWVEETNATETKRKAKEEEKREAVKRLWARRRAFPRIPLTEELAAKLGGGARVMATPYELYRAIVRKPLDGRGNWLRYTTPGKYTYDQLAPDSLAYFESIAEADHVRYKDETDYFWGQYDDRVYINYDE